MRSKIPILLAVLFFTACTTKSVVENPEAQNTETSTTNTEVNVVADKPATVTKIESDSSEPEKSAAEIEAESVAAKEAAAAAATKKAESKLDSLSKELETATKAWQEARSEAKTADERRAWFAGNPANKFGKEFIAIAKANPGTDVARRAWSQALMRGDAASKKSAMAGLMKAADTDMDASKKKGIYVMLTQFGSGEHQTSAMTRLLDTTLKDLESNKEDKVRSAEQMLVQLVSNRGDDGVRESASAHLMEIVDKDVRSNLSAKRLATLATQGVGKARETALTRLIDHHIDSDHITDFLERGTRQVNATTEAALKQICEKGTGHVQAKAAIALAKFIDRRDKSRGYYSGANEEVLARLDSETKDYYLNQDIDPNEGANLEAMLSSYVSNNSPLMDSAAEQLFVLQNLSVGKSAPEIVGSDLDGVEFKLSDYRGKVVFLDFWGDW